MNKKKIPCPHWSENEIKLLDKELENKVRNALYLRQVLIKRLNWTTDPRFRFMVSDFHSFIIGKNKQARNFFQSFINEYLC